MAWITPQRELTISEMQQNALEIWNWWHAAPRYYSLESCAALLGNMQAESTINPAQYERGHGNFTDVETWSYGFGLIQWTPCRQYYSAMNNVGLSIIYPNDQLAWLDYESVPGRGYYFMNPNYSYRFWNWYDFRYADNPADVEDLAICYMWSRERPAYSESSIRARRENARYWYTFLGGHTPIRVPVWLLFKLKENNENGR